MKSYRDLQIYAVSKQLAIEIHKITLSLPKFELFEEGSQIRRSSKSVTSSIIKESGKTMNHLAKRLMYIFSGFQKT